jgi:hypothetical protein
MPPDLYHADPKHKEDGNEAIQSGNEYLFYGADKRSADSKRPGR